jgi:hypothetical protein
VRSLKPDAVIEHFDGLADAIGRVMRTSRAQPVAVASAL